MNSAKYLLFIALFANSARASLVVYPENTFRGGVLFVRASAEAEPVILERNGVAIPWGVCPDQKKDLCAFVGIPIDDTPDRIAIEVKGAEQKVVASASLVVKPTKSKTTILKVAPSHVQVSPEDDARMKAERVELDLIYQNSSAEALSTGKFEMPAQGKPTSRFGTQRSFNGKVMSTHYGLDLRGNEKTWVKASNAGKVVLAKNLFNGGNMVVVDHGGGIFSSYSHLSQFAVKTGDEIKKGQHVGRAGRTGRVTGPHIHWAIRIRELFVDPMEFVRVFNHAYGPSKRNK